MGAFVIGTSMWILNIFLLLIFLQIVSLRRKYQNKQATKRKVNFLKYRFPHLTLVSVNHKTGQCTITCQYHYQKNKYKSVYYNDLVNSFYGCPMCEHFIFHNPPNKIQSDLLLGYFYQRKQLHFVRFKNSSEFHTLLELDTLCATQERNNPDLKVIALNKKLNRNNQEELSFLLVENINPVSRKLFMIKYNVQMNKTSDRIFLYQ